MFCQILMANMSQTRILQVSRFCKESLQVSLQVSEIILKQFGVHNSSWGYYPKESSKRGLIMSSFCSLWYLSIRYVDKLWVTIRSCYMCWIRCLHFRWFSNSLQYVLSDHHGRPPTPTGAQSWCRWPVLDIQVIEYWTTEELNMASQFITFSRQAWYCGKIKYMTISRETFSPS